MPNTMETVPEYDTVVILRICFLSIDRIFPVILPILFDFIGRHSES